MCCVGAGKPIPSLQVPIKYLSTLMFLVVFALLLTVNIRQARQETASARRKAKLNPGR